MTSMMNDRTCLAPIRPRFSGHTRPPEDVLFAIGELAHHVRALNLAHADTLLTELLVLLYAERRGGVAGWEPHGAA
jgi:hypothetical protein